MSDRVAAPDEPLAEPHRPHRSFLHAVAGTAGVNIGISVLGSLGGLLLARGLGPSQRGDLATIIVWPSLIGTITALGLPQATCYLISRMQGERRQIVSTAAAGLAIMGTIVGIIGAALSPFISDKSSVVLGLQVMFLLLPAVFVSGGLVSALQATNAGRWNIARFIQPVVYFAGIAALLGVHHLSVRWAVVAYLFSIVAQIALAAFVVRTTIGRLARPEARLWHPLFAYGWRAVASSAPWLINARFDQVVLSVTVASAALGNYAVAVSLSFLAGPLASAFGSIAFPRIAATKSEHEAKSLQRTAIIGCVVTATVVLVPLAITASWLIPFLFGDGYDSAVSAFRLLVPGTVAFATNQVLGDILRGRGRPLDVAKAEGIGAVLTVGLLAFMIPRYGIDGAALASSVAYTLVTLILWRGLSRGGARIDQSLPNSEAADAAAAGELAAGGATGAVPGDGVS